MTLPMPSWLADREDDGKGWSAASRFARQLRCGSCGQAVWRGPDADVGAFTVTTDVEPLTAAQEFEAHWHGLRDTYALRRGPGRRVYLDRRDHWQIRGEPAGTRETGFRAYVVLAEHACPTPTPTPEGIRR